MCSNHWDFLDEWSSCLSENHYCGDGIQWRRQLCLDEDGNVYPDELCLFTGEVPLFETRECTLDQSCCEFGELIDVECDSLFIDDDSNSQVCVTPWAERECICSDSTDTDSKTKTGDSFEDQTKCLWTSSTLENPPIVYDLTDFCIFGDEFDEETACYEFDSNDTCLFWEVVLDYRNGDILEISERSEMESEECYTSIPNCWDGWTEWSTCAGTCDEAYQWRRQTTSQGLSACRQPPSFEYRSCNLTDCCEWVYDETMSWSNCSELCGEGIQIRFPYSCSCDDEYLCPPPEFEYETRDCEMTESTCCKFDDQSEPTLCDVTSSESWYTEKCVCEDSDSSCDISNCYGVPLYSTLPCECVEIPVPSEPKIPPPEKPSEPKIPPSEKPSESKPPSPPVCVWREVVSPCKADCFGDSQDHTPTTNTKDDEDCDETTSKDEGKDNGTTKTTDEGKDYGTTPTKDEGKDYGTTPTKDEGKDYGTTPTKDEGKDYGTTPTKDEGKDYGTTNTKDEGKDHGTTKTKDEGKDYGTTPTKDEGKDYGTTPTKDEEKDYGTTKTKDEGKDYQRKRSKNDKTGTTTKDEEKDYGTTKTKDEGKDYGTTKTKDEGKDYGTTGKDEGKDSGTTKKDSGTTKDEGKDYGTTGKDEGKDSGTTKKDSGTTKKDEGKDYGTNTKDEEEDRDETTSKDEGKDSGTTKKDNGHTTKKPEGKDSGSKDTKPTDTSKCSNQGCLTVTRSCYCDGVLTDDSECPFLDLPTTQTFDCSLNCDDCEWINLSEWSPCANNTRFLTRECSCDEKQESSYHQSSGDSSAYSYSSFCNGYTRLFQSCQTNLEYLSVENWKSSPWPLKADTELRTFNCSSLTWFNLFQKSSLNPWETLALEFIAAHLNLLSGYSPSDKLLKALDSADKLLLTCTWTKAQTSESKDLLFSLRDSFDSNEVMKIETSEEEDSNGDQSSNSNSPQLLFMILIPAVLLVIAIIVVVVYFIKKRAEDKNTVSL
jgi:hypothetical protein